MSLRDLLILLIGIGVPLWLLRPILAKYQARLKELFIGLGEAFTGSGNREQGFWRLFIIFNTLLAPAVCNTLNVQASLAYELGFAYQFRETVAIAPLSALLLYIAFRSRCQGRWKKVFSASLLVTSGYAIQVFVLFLWLPQTIVLETFFHLPIWAIFSFGNVIGYLVASRIFGIQLVRENEAALHPSGINLRFFFWLQAALALLIVLLIWLYTFEIQGAESFAYFFSRELPFLLLCGMTVFNSVLYAVSVFYPTTRKQWLIALGLIGCAFALSIVTEYFWVRESLLGQDQLDQIPSISTFFAPQNLFGHALYIAVNLLAIRFLFHQSGLRIASGGEQQSTARRS